MQIISSAVLHANLFQRKREQILALNGFFPLFNLKNFCGDNIRIY